MNLKKKIQGTIFHKGYINTRYWLYRYVVDRLFLPYEYYQANPEDANSIDLGNTTFFGYYGLSPENNNNELIYCDLQKKCSEKPCGGLAIRCRNAVNNQTIIASTTAWNWQQGCMLQWMPPNFENIIFNDYDEHNDRYISLIVDKNGDIVKKYPMPIYSISPKGDMALSLNFDRLAKMRPDYGYFQRKLEKLYPDDKDGIWHIDLLNGKTKLILSLDQLKHIDPTDTMVDAQHKVNHIDINPVGKRFMFLHRWIGPKGRFMRLITANCDGTELHILNGDQMTSHSCWLNEKEIISFCYIINQGTGYFKIIDRIGNAKLLSEKLPKNDGHPSVSSDGKWLITDTYPDRSRMSWLILFNLQNDAMIKLGRFYQPLRYMGEKRIDLHPKWSIDNQSIFFESGHSGTRRLYSLDISQQVGREK